MSAIVSAIPVTVVGGYLGAGKTTLINSVLSGDHGRRVAVLVNDFGDVNIDAALIANRDGTTIELTNGCACCTISDGLGEAFLAVADRVPPFDHVIVEASGVADPARLAAWASLPGFCLDGIVVLVDPETIQAKSVDRYVGATVLSQISAADLLVLTKSDLVGPASVAAVRSWLQTVHPTAPIVESSGVVPFDVIVGNVHVGAAAVVGIADDHAAIHRSVVLRFDRPFDETLLVDVFRTPTPGFLRAKGLVVVDGWTQRGVLQVVGARTTLTRSAQPVGEDSDGSVIVLIGTAAELDVDTLGERLAAACGS